MQMLISTLEEMDSARKRLVPEMGHVHPWRACHDDKVDKKLMRNEPMEDGWLHFRKKGAVAASVEEEAELAIAAE